MVVQQQLLGSQIPPFAHYTHKSFGANLNVSQEAPPAKKPRKQSLVRKSGAASFNGLLIGGTAAADSPKKRGRVPSLKTRIAAAAAAAQQNGQSQSAAPTNLQGWPNAPNPAMNGAKGLPDQQFLKQLQQHLFQQQQLYQQQQRSQQPQGHVNFVGKATESALCSPPPASANCVTGAENAMANNKQNHLQFSPTMAPTGFGQFNGQQVVPELNSNSIGVLSSPPHHQHPHSVLLTPPSEHGHQNAQAYPAFSEKQQDVSQQLAFQQYNALQAQQQSPINMNSLIAALAQQHANMTSTGVPTSNGISLAQLPIGTQPSQAMLYAALMQQSGSTATLQALLQQQLAGGYESGQQSAAQAVMMQLAIQKELQILYQRQHLHQMLSNAAAAQQRQSPPQPAQQNHLIQHPLNFVSPPLTHTPASDEASYATSSPHSFAASSSSLGSNEASRSPPLTSMTFQPSQNGESAFGSPQPTASEANYGTVNAFEQSIRQGNTFSEMPERRLTEKEMQAIHSLINLREGGSNSHN